MKKIVILLSFLACSTLMLQAQTDTTIVNRAPANDTTEVYEQSSSNVLSEFLIFMTEKSKKKKNTRPNYSGWRSEPYFGFGLMAGELENSPAKINYGDSYSLDFGVKHRYQFTGIYSLTFNIGFMHNLYTISNGISNNIVGENVSFGGENLTINNEYFRTWAVGGSIGQRFNCSKTGGLKNYIEISVYGNILFSRNYIIHYEGPNNTSSTVYYKNANLFNPFEAGAQVNLGFHWFSVWGRYRLTDWFSADYTSAKLPRLVIGIAANLDSSW